MKARRTSARKAAFAAVVVLATVGLGLGAGAIPGTADPTYGVDGTAVVPTAVGTSSFPVQLATTPSGAVWATVWDQSSTGGSSITGLSRIIRFAPDGSVVGELSVDQFVPVPPPGPFGFGSYRLSSIAADGEAVYVAVMSGSKSSLLRIRPDVTLDPGFTGDGDFASDVEGAGLTGGGACGPYCGLTLPEVATAPDGSVYTVVGTSSGSGAVAKIERDGTLDAGFGGTGLVPVDLSMRGVAGLQFGSIRVDSQGRVLVIAPGGVLRLLPDGSTDSTFGTGEAAGVARFTAPASTASGDSYSCSSIIGESCVTAVASDGSLVTAANAYGSDGSQHYVLLSTSPTGAVTAHQLCQFDSSTPGPQGCAAPYALFAGSSHGAVDDELHFVTGNLLRTLPLPLPSGDLLPQAVASSSDSMLLIGGARGLGRTAFVSGATIVDNGAGGVMPKGGLKRINLDVAPPTDTTPPTITVSSQGAALASEYTVNSAVPVDFSCADTGAYASGVASCSASVVQGHPQTDPGDGAWYGILFTSVGDWTLFVHAVDHLGNESVLRHEYTVVDGIDADLAPGGSVRSSGFGDQIDAGIRLADGGHVRLVHQVPAGSPTGYQLGTDQIRITQPTSTAANPAEIDLLASTRTIADATAADVAVFKDGVLVPPCNAGALPSASPDPCVKDRQSVDGYGVDIFVLSSTGGTWVMGKALAPPSAPGAPTGVQAAAGPKKADVSWTPPASTGGAPISASYILATPVAGSVDPATGSLATAKSKAIATGDAAGSITLASGVSYDITVRSRNGVVTAYGPYSSPAVRVTTPRVPSAPNGVTAAPGAKKATVSWTAPSSDAAVTGYVVTANPTAGGAAVSKTLTTPVTSYDLTGLQSGVAFTFTVKAVSGAGTSAASAPSAPVTTFVIQDPPTNVSATPGVRTVTVSWTAPASASPITGYTVAVTPTAGGATTTKPVGASATSYKVTGLLDATAYSFTVSATSAAGTSVASVPSPVVSTFAVQGPPTDVAATAGVRSAKVTWTPPVSDSPITGYALVATPVAGGATITKTAAATATSYTFTGLTNATGYTFTATAKSAVGTSVSSPPTAALTTPDVPRVLTWITSTPGDRTLEIRWPNAITDVGFAATKYTVKLTGTKPDGTPISITKTVTPVADSFFQYANVTGLIPGVAYAVTVSSTNAVGTSAASDPVAGGVWVGLSVADITTVEGTASSTKTVNVPVRLSGAASQDITFRIRTEDGTAASPGDFVSLPRTTFTIPAGKTSVNVPVKVVRDSLHEGAETFDLVIDDASASQGMWFPIVRPTATFTITDDD